MNNSLKVSVIVPVYNVEKYLEQCILSITAQTHNNLEILLVNDGSTDKSGAIADAFAEKDPRIKVIHKENAGVSRARNTGIEQATGEYVCFADGDDYLLPDYVEYLLGMAVKHDADVALTTDMFTTFDRSEGKPAEERIKTPEEATIDILSYRLPIGVYCKIFRRSFLGNEIRFIPELFIGEGFNFNTMAFQRANKVIEGNRRVYFYRRNNPTSATTAFSLAKWENALCAIERIREDFILHSDNLITAWNYANWHTHCDAFTFLVMANQQKSYPEQYKKWRSVVRKEAHNAFRVKIVLKEKIRGIIMLCYPEIMPWIISKRNSRYQ